LHRLRDETPPACGVERVDHEAGHIG
jgi:hypothetical protein